MSDQPIQMSAGLPTTVLPESDAAERDALAQALAAPDPKPAIAAIVAANPRSLDGLVGVRRPQRRRDRAATPPTGSAITEDSTRCVRTDGVAPGYVRWSAPGNHGFLRSLLGLGLMAEAIGEARRSRALCPVPVSSSTRRACRPT